VCVCGVCGVCVCVCVCVWCVCVSGHCIRLGFVTSDGMSMKEIRTFRLNITFTLKRTARPRWGVEV